MNKGNFGDGGRDWLRTVARTARELMAEVLPTSECQEGSAIIPHNQGWEIVVENRLFVQI